MKDLNSKTLFTILLVTSCLSQIRCDLSPPDNSAEKTTFPLDGTLDYVSFPAVGRLEMRDPTGGVGGYARCTATLISEKHVLSAGHCCSPPGYPTFEPVAYYYIDTWGEIAKDIADYWEGPGDSCVLELETRVTGIDPMVIWPDLYNYLIGRPIIQVGYGKLWDDTGGGIRRSQTRNYISRFRGDGTFYTRYNDTHGGDSGGPAIITTDDGIDMVVGIAISGDYGTLDDCAEYDTYEAIAGPLYSFIVSIISSETGPLDTDNDTVLDSVDNCPSDYNPPPSYGSRDRDGDGRGNRCDNCELTPNPDQLNSDITYTGVCPIFKPDEWGNACDLCPSLYTITKQGDRDGDGIGDACDLCPNQHPVADVCYDETRTGCNHPPYFSDYQVHGAHSVDDDRMFQDNIDHLDDDRYGLPYFTTSAAPQYRNDPDGDTIGNLCDNCRYTPNVYQADCNSLWEMRTRKEDLTIPDVYIDIDMLGDACDPLPCNDVKTIDPSILHPSYHRYTSTGTGVCQVSSISTSDNVFYSEIILGNSGFESDTPYEGRYRYNDTDTGYCQCSGCANCDYIKNCRNDVCPETGEINPAAGWHYLRREGGSGRMPDVTFRRMYGIPWDGDEDPINEWDCYTLPQFTPAIREDYPGCAYRDYDTFNSGGFFGITDHIIEEQWNWWKQSSLGCGNRTDCERWVRTMFKPIWEDVPLWEDSRFNVTFYPEYDEYNAIDYINTKAIRLGPSCIRTIWDGDDDERRDRWIGRYSPWWEDLLDIHAARGSTVLILESFHKDIRPENVGKWRFDKVPAMAASQGLMISQYDFMNGAFIDFHESRFASSEDYIDVLDYVAIQLSSSLPQDLMEDRTQGVGNLPELWVFGGRDLAGLRNDLWHGIPKEENNEVVINWIRIPSNADQFKQQAPPIAGGAMFYNEELHSLIVWGGESNTGPSNETYSYSIYDNTWKKERSTGDVPPRLVAFAYAQVGDTGYVWGGVDADGTIHNDLYAIDISRMHFVVDGLERDGPPAMVGASISADPLSHRLYLYGGYDGEIYHNWLWSYVDGQGWTLESSDCSTGVCPYRSYKPLVFSNDVESLVTVIPGFDLSGATGKYDEHYHLRSKGEWLPASQLSPSWHHRADCDGDGVGEVGFEKLCGSGIWWNQPGRYVCDTESSALICDEITSIPHSINTVLRNGVKDFEVQDSLLLATRHKTLVVQDITDSAHPKKTDKVHFECKAGDVEKSGELVAVAAGSSIHLLDASNPKKIQTYSELHACGKATALAIEGDTMYHLTRIGIGQSDISDPSNPQLTKMTFILPNGRGKWGAFDVDPSFCSRWEIHEDIVCSWFSGCKYANITPFQVYGDHGYIATLGTLHVISLNGELSSQVVGSIDLGKIIKHIRYDQSNVYIVHVDGSTSIVSVLDPSAPIKVGSHNITPWVAGTEFSFGRAFSIQHGTLKVASTW